MGVLCLVVYQGKAVLGALDAWGGTDRSAASCEEQRKSEPFAIRPVAKNSNIADVHTADAEMNAARAKARGSLEGFWSSVRNPGPGESGFMIKAALETRCGSREHIWVANPKRNGSTISGRLANDPRDLKGLRNGSSVTFEPDQITDWTFNRNGRIVGNETARVLVGRMTDSDAAKIRAKFE